MPGPEDGAEMAVPVGQEELGDHLDSLSMCHSLWGHRSRLHSQAELWVSR